MTQINPNVSPTRSESSQGRVNPAQLKSLLAALFNLAELRDLCFALSVEYEDLEGNRTGKAIELVKYFERRGNLIDLAQAIQRVRPNVTWEDLTRSEAESAVPLPGESPYKGLNYFDVDDWERFFGREALTAELVRALHQYRFLAVVGASGSGKSSIVRAGLIPTLRGVRPLDDQSTPLPKGSQRWQVYVLTPTDRPLMALATGMSSSVQDVMKRMKTFTADSRSLDIQIRLNLKQAQAPRALLVIDQFEELFTLCHDPAERKAFIDNILTAANPQTGGAATVVITLRADFYAQCAEHELLRQLLSQQQIYIGPMSQTELRRAIEIPAHRQGWRFEDRLVDLILEDIGDEPGALPLLSHALLETWKRRDGDRMTIAGYVGSGGIRGAIAQTADQVFQQELQTKEDKEIARRIFLRLTALGEGMQDTRRRVNLNEIVRQSEDNLAVRSVLQKLVASRLVVTSEETAEVSHEALIREWPTLRRWLEESREDLQIQRDLSEAAREWEELGREAGALYRGTRLARAREWAQVHPAELNELERAFLDTSYETAVAAEREREGARRHALMSAQRAAKEAEARRAAEEKIGQARTRQLRIAVGLGIVAVFLAAFAFLQFVSANSARRNAEKSEATAVAEATRAFIASVGESEARDAEARAVSAQSTADAARLISAGNEEAAVAAQGTANAEKATADAARATALDNEAAAVAAQNELSTREAEARGDLDSLEGTANAIQAQSALDQAAAQAAQNEAANKEATAVAAQITAEVVQTVALDALNTAEARAIYLASYTLSFDQNRINISWRDTSGVWEQADLYLINSREPNDGPRISIGDGLSFDNARLDINLDYEDLKAMNDGRTDSFQLLMVAYRNSGQVQTEYISYAYPEGRACPFVYTYDAASQSWQLDTTIIYNLVGPESERQQWRELQQFDGRLLIREIEPEISHLDQVYVVVVDSQGRETALEHNFPLLRAADDNYFIMHQGEQHELTFPGYADLDDVVTVWVVAEGYYEPVEATDHSQ